ncbi:S8 family peptidase [Kribbella turkmenica]|uniref:S8 family peptidase n=1 Tax=Kribbella turkmenica TaxID=2530375 RepID=UPI001405162D|nr:S8 family peptidase [Kribbella turkmenica]
MLAAVMITPRAGAAWAAAEGPIRNAGGPGVIEDRYIVVFTDAVRRGAVGEAARGLASRHGARVTQTYSAALSGFAATMTEQQARRIAADPAVAYVEPDRVMRIASDQPDPPWGLDRIDERYLPMNQNYKYDTTAGWVNVYVIDTGIRISHNEFGGRASYGRDTVNEDNIASDCNGHGTHVAGTVGGTTYGVAKAARLIAVKVMNCAGDGTVSNIVQGIDWVTANHVRPAVATMSLGGSGSGSIDDAVKRSSDQGVTYVVAAGNDNDDACDYSPARVLDAITVGATEQDDDRWPDSNKGRCLDLFAPGRGVLSALKTSDTATGTKSGTSMAVPHVAGAAALYLSKSPTASPLQVAYSLRYNVTKNQIDDVGTGSPNRLLYRVHGPTVRTMTCTGGTSIACSMTTSPGTVESLWWTFNGTSGWYGQRSISAGCPSGPQGPGGWVIVELTVTVTDANSNSADQRYARVACRP